MPQNTSDLYSLELTGDSDVQNEVFLKAFNSGDGAVFDRLYREDAISNLSGRPLNGEERKPFVEKFMAARPTMTKAEIKHSYVTTATALLVVEWAMDIPGQDGSVEHLTGTALDVLRRGDDGLWRYAIDHPFGEGN